MAITSSKRVTSGYFRNHLYVTLGLTTLAALLSYSVAPEAFWYAVAAAVFSYVASICWLYEMPTAGKVTLVIVAGVSLGGSFEQMSSRYAPESEQVRLDRYFTNPAAGDTNSAADAEALEQRAKLLGVGTALLHMASTLSSGLLLGMTMAAMLLGHWYLNSPTMELVPLKRLILAIGAAVALQAVVSLLGLWGELASSSFQSTQWILFVVLRWAFGLFGVGALAWMAWETLKIPNTQSATGILYVAVIGTFDPFSISGGVDIDKLDAEEVAQILVGDLSDEDVIEGEDTEATGEDTEATAEDNPTAVVNSTLNTNATTHVMLNKVLVTRIQSEQLPTERTDANGDPIDTGVLVPTGNLLVTFALDPHQVEQLIFTAEFGRIWLSYEPIDASEEELEVVTRVNVYGHLHEDPDADDAVVEPISDTTEAEEVAS